MSPSCSPDADVLADAHVSDDLTVNQCWDVSSDVQLCFSASSAMKRNWILFWMLVSSNSSGGLNMQQ